MKRILNLIGFCLLFTTVVFGQGNSGKGNGNSNKSKHIGNKVNNNRNSKIDERLTRKVNAGKKDWAKGKEKIRVIIQHVQAPSVLEKTNLQRNGSIKKELKGIRALVVELTVDQIENEAAKANVSKVSIDEPIKASTTTESGVVTGASLATATYGVTGSGIGVAVIDSGIFGHRDLTVVAAVDFVNSNWHGGHDPYGHGTHVAGIIAGNGGASGGGHKGIATGVNLIDLRVLDQVGQGYTSDAISAIDWAIANKNTVVGGQSLNIRVINLSLGHQPFESADTDPLTTACRTAVQNGLVVVVSAGNYGKNTAGTTVYGGILSPGTESTVITVGSMTTFGTDSRSDDAIATYSSRGPTPFDQLAKPDLLAPGYSVYSAMAPGSDLANSFPTLHQAGSGGDYIRLSGTSMAAPAVAATAALMLQANPTLTPNAIKAALMFTAEDRGLTPLAQGAGYMNSAGAVNLAKNINTSVPTGQYWLLNNGTGLTYTDVIAGYPAVWSHDIVYGNSVMSGTPIFYNTALWGTTIAWDDLDGLTIAWDDLDGLTIAWDDLDGLTIAWDDLDGLTIAWDDLDGLTIAWDDLDGQTVYGDQF